MDPDQNMGALYPFSLRQKLKVITEPSPCYSDGATPGGGPSSRWRCSACCSQYPARAATGFPCAGPAVGLFADQEIRLIDGPLFVGEDYFAEREIVALSGSRRTESMWVRTTVLDAGETPVATMLLNLASLKDSYANYQREYGELYGETKTA